MSKFDIFRAERSHPFPKTMRTALRAMRIGIEGPEPFYFRATSIDSIHKRPLDPGSVKELLARSGLDARRNHELSRALFDGLTDEDRDLADFAAQGLSRIENRYQDVIKEQEAKLKAEDTEASRSRMAELLLDFAEIQWFDQTLRSFYIWKAQELLEALAERRGGFESPRPAKLLIRCHLMHRNLDRAGELVESYPFEQEPEVLLLQAHLAFLRRDVDTVVTIMRELQEYAVDEETKDLIAGWLEEER